MGSEAGERLNLVERCLERGRRADREARDAQAFTVESNGCHFPSVEWEGQYVAEALSYRQNKLPHLRSKEERDRTFPQAVAARAANDEDLLELNEDALEQRGKAAVERSQRGAGKLKSTEKEDRCKASTEDKLTEERQREQKRSGSMSLIRPIYCF